MSSKVHRATAGRQACPSFCFLCTVNRLNKQLVQHLRHDDVLLSVPHVWLHVSVISASRLLLSVCSPLPRISRSFFLVPHFLLLERHKSWHAALSAILTVWPCLMFAIIVRRDSPPDPLLGKHFCNSLSVPLRPAPRQFGCLRPPRRGLNQSFVLLPFFTPSSGATSRLKCLISSAWLNFHPAAQAFFPCLVFSLSSSALNATLTGVVIHCECVPQVSSISAQ